MATESTIDIKSDLIVWFCERSGYENIDTETSFFEQGIIDSFDVIELIEFIEEKYRFSFSEENFQDRRFATISGLSQIVFEQTSEGK